MIKQTAATVSVHLLSAWYDTNAITDSTFYFWQPGHHGIHHAGNWAYLYKPLRTKLNKLVTDLNAKLKIIIDNVNKDFSDPRVIFADPNPTFEGHRFCEPGITEPDPDNANNWFFLASWDDDSLPGTTTKGASIASELLEKAEQNWSIPDTETCASTNDWAELMLCELADIGFLYNDGDKVVMAPSIELPDGNNMSTTEISWYVPTAWAKTFHPRTLGHLGIRELVRQTW
jgi:hypothetical protein